MAHFLRIRPRWVRGVPLTGAEVAAIDETTFLALNGDDGGTWTPSGPIVFGGEGLTFAGPSSMSGANSAVNAGPLAPIVFGKGTDDDYFGLPSGHPERARNATQLITEWFAPYPELFVFGHPAAEFAEGGNMGVTSTFAARVTSSTQEGSRFQAPLRTYEGARLTRVDFTFRVNTGGGGIAPTNLPRFRVIAVDRNGGVFPLRAPDGTTDENGFQYFAPAPSPNTRDAWYALGEMQTFQYVCNEAARQVIDLATYHYLLEFLEESGPGTWELGFGTTLISAISLYDTITLLDGRG